MKTKSNNFTLIKISLVLFLSTTLFTPALHAQEVPYTPFPTNSLNWSVWGDNNLHDTHCGIHYALEGNALIAFKIYTQVYCSTNHQTLAFIREENKKIYYMLPEDPDYKERLLYDFNLDIGDTIFYDIAMYYDVRDNKIRFGFMNEEYFAVVKEKGITTLKDGSVRNTLLVQGNYFWKYWIEGLGGTEIGLFDPLNVEFVLDGSSAALICITKEENNPNSCLYAYEGVHAQPEAGFCPCMPNAVIENGKNKITVLPNPTTGELTITNYELRIRDVEIYDVYGRKMISDIRCPISDIGKSDIGKSEIEINIAHLPQGLYFIKVDTENGVFVEKVIKN